MMTVSEIVGEIQMIDTRVGLLLRRRNELTDGLERFAPWKVGDRFRCIGAGRDRGQWEVVSVRTTAYRSFRHGEPPTTQWHLAAARIGKRGALTKEVRTFNSAIHAGELIPD
jgi:hypothetical protein